MASLIRVTPRRYPGVGRTNPDARPEEGDEVRGGELRAKRDLVEQEEKNDRRAVVAHGLTRNEHSEPRRHSETLPERTS